MKRLLIQMLRRRSLSARAWGRPLRPPAVM